ncbi:MAG: sensor histidine kinase [Alphaproteobacteria bacterium]|nr:sensor histidine kinase [Alphaproteobacteria bacterium]
MPGRRDWTERVLRTPLLMKLVILDVSINVVAFVAVWFAPPEQLQALTAVSLLVVLVLNAAMVAWALTPLQALEDTAWRVSQGERGVRTRMPAIADRNLVRIGQTLDRLLDRVEADRARERWLASQVVAAGERERARIARELHDGIAQSLSAVEMLIGTSLAATDPQDRSAHLPVMREIVGEALADMRQLAHNLHPSVLDDLGLPAALQSLARRSPGNVTVVVEGDGEVSAEVAAATYRVAQEAIGNALRHGGGAVRVRLTIGEERVDLEVVDDGKGFDPESASDGLGLLLMEERATMLEGTFELKSAVGEGTSVTMSVPTRGMA